MNNRVIHIGVLAKLGHESCLQQWTPTATYLNKYFPEYYAQIVCLDFDEVEKAVADKLVDFTITNPSVYVNLEYKYGASRIATLKNKRANSSYTRFGGVIFYKAGRHDLKTINDLKGKKFLAVSDTSFGGWQVAWRYLQDRDLDPHQDFQKLIFAGRHDLVVKGILEGKADVGGVRTDTLERMAWAGEINLDDLEIFDPQEMNPEFDFLRTTRLYPEWPLAKVQHTPVRLAKKVTIAMLQMAADSQAARSSHSMGWTIPLEYHEIQDTLRLLRVAPYESFGKITYRQLYQQYKVWISITAIFLTCTCCGLTITFLLNRRLKKTLVELDTEHQHRAQVVDDLNEFKLTLDQTLDCVFMFSADTLQYIYANHGALKHIGYSIEELLNMTPLDIKSDVTEDQFRSMITPLKEKMGTSLTYISCHQKKNGTITPVEVFLQHITPPRKQGRFVAIVRDITIRQQKEQERKQLQTKLLQEQKLASVGQLAAGIAHEINTPAQYLGSNLDFLNDAFEDITELITQYDQLLETTTEEELSPQLITTVQKRVAALDWPYLKEEIPQAINQSVKGLEQVRSIVLAMKNLSHPGSTEKELTDLNDLVQTTLTVSRNEWKLLLEPILNLDPDLPPVLCMRNEIGQVFLNMIINAAHSIAEKDGVPSEGKKGHITISSQRQNNTVVLSFADSGCGISQENLAKIFDPFFTTKAVGKGTGQGLAISYDIIINKHDGNVDVASEEGIGTTFTITLPVNLVQQQEAKEIFSG